MRIDASWGPPVPHAHTRRDARRQPKVPTSRAGELDVLDVPSIFDAHTSNRGAPVSTIARRILPKDCIYYSIVNVRLKIPSSKYIFRYRTFVLRSGYWEIERADRLTGTFVYK